VQQLQRTVADPDPEAVSRARVLCPSPRPPEPDVRLENLVPASGHNEKPPREADRPSPAKLRPRALNPLFAVPSAFNQLLPADPAEISPPAPPSRQPAPPTPHGDAPRRVATVLDAWTRMPVFSPLPVPIAAGGAVPHRPDDGRPYATAPDAWQRPEAPGAAPSPQRTASADGSAHPQTPRASDAEVPSAGGMPSPDATRTPSKYAAPGVGVEAPDTSSQSSACAVATDRPAAGAQQAGGSAAAVVTVSTGRMADNPAPGGREPSANIPPVRPTPGAARPGERHMAQPARSEDRTASTGQASPNRRDHEATPLVERVVPIVDRAVEGWIATQTSAPPDWRSDAIRLTSGSDPSQTFQGAFGQTIRVVRDGVVEGRIGQDGAVAVRVTAEQADNGLRIVVRLDDRSLAAELEAQRPKLLQALQARGLSVAGVQIVGGPVRGTGFAARRFGPLESPDDDVSDRVEAQTEAESEQDEDHTAERWSFRA
jgi:hypothetical protein